MPAVPSNNRLHAEINKYYIIHVYEYKDTVEEVVNGKTKMVNRYFPQIIVSASTLSRYITDEKSRISLFNDVLEAGLNKYPRLIRKRLKIEFRLK